MKKKGFTLIELLAVIVVLAIIALIATPIVMNVIKKANEGAVMRSADNYVKAVETLIATEKLDGTPLVDGEYEIDTNGKLTKDGKEYEVEVSGKKPVNGTITIEKGQVVKDDTTTIEYEDYTVKYPNGKAEATEKGEALVLCRAVEPVFQSLFDPSNGMTYDDKVGIRATEETKYASGAVNSCNLGDRDRIFYVLNSTKNTVSLLMGENIGSAVTWCADGGTDNSCLADGAIAYLNSQINGWKKLQEADGTVTLPTKDDISGVGSQTFILSNIGPYNFEFVGYWTSTSFKTQRAWAVDGAAGLISGAIENGGYYGVRPVITISKENMSLN